MSDPTNVDVVLGGNPDSTAPDGSVIKGLKTAVIQDHKANRAWSGEGATHDQAATEATRKFRAREYVG